MKIVDLQAEKAHRSNLAKDWTVRLALEDALRKLDEDGHFVNKSTRCVLVFGSVNDEGGTVVDLLVCSENAFETSGLLAEAMHNVIAQ